MNADDLRNIRDERSLDEILDEIAASIEDSEVEMSERVLTVRGNAVTIGHMTTTLITSANTIAGFAIGIIRTGEVYSVVRMDRESRYVRLSNHTSEQSARTAANLEYRKDLGR